MHKQLKKTIRQASDLLPLEVEKFIRQIPLPSDQKSFAYMYLAAFIGMIETFMGNNPNLTISKIKDLGKYHKFYHQDFILENPYDSSDQYQVEFTGYSDSVGDSTIIQFNYDGEIFYIYVTGSGKTRISILL